MKRNKNVEIKKSTAGMGLFAIKNIKKDIKMVQYTGEIINEKEADRRGGKYLMDYKDRYIDGKTYKNLGRWANHSCRPNSEAVEYSNGIFIVSKRKIKEGEEITYNYGKEYFNDHIKPYGCRCSKCYRKKP